MQMFDDHVYNDPSMGGSGPIIQYLLTEGAKTNFNIEEKSLAIIARLPDILKLRTAQVLLTNNSLDNAVQVAALNAQLHTLQTTLAQTQQQLQAATQQLQQLQLQPAQQQPSNAKKRKKRWEVEYLNTVCDICYDWRKINHSNQDFEF